MNQSDSLNGYVADTVRAEMARRKMTQQQLADAIGMSQRAMSRRMRNEAQITVTEASRIAQVLELPVSALLPEPVAS